MQVFYSNPWIPVEWIKAHGLEPCGAWCATDLWRDLPALSAGVCPFAKSVCRLAATQTEPAMVLATTCDQMRRGFDAYLADAGSRVFLFNIPATWQTPVAQKVYRSEVERLGRFLERLGGHAPSRQALRETMAQYSQARGQLLAAMGCCSPRQFAEAVGWFHSHGSVTLNSSPREPRTDGVPLAVVGGPLLPSQWDLLEMIETAGARVALNATETGERSLLPSFDWEDSDDDPVGVLVRGYQESIVDAFQRPNNRLYAWLGQRLSSRRVRGIVLWVYTGCDLWRAEAQPLHETFGLPVLLLESDTTQGCTPRDVGRVQAFVETLK
jgi:benzoyl-CoA reductase/2-hydroxyglutaryl-CoA dehydratase subunit BcrC/BadD/HgdB